ncbi:hypothetical protein P170DRAFT_472041 [Aspergillus steynii IBT 23096]|uniref:Uncharacterized protein n=1 Tax=Aspergillus steynii IBT 23096 TaxID=1392250 RepID=A0A2I2GGY8_9EURO|nr:uncharacterized protein P170DRAFT_472041 [Aspergillus steynii IBT 23096]PLB52132.1 hypothetical protein P170DRAFT_472041 [Aspergillus steynii IBT 23096]
MSCPCLYDPRNAVIDKPQTPRIVRQVSQRTNDARAPLPGGLSRTSGSIEHKTASPTKSTSLPRNSHGRSTALPPKGILKHPTKRFPFEEAAGQRSSVLRFEVGKLSTEFVLDEDMVEVHAKRRGGKQPRDSMVVVDEARTRARRRFLAEKGSREALLGESD